MGGKAVCYKGYLNSYTHKSIDSFIVSNIKIIGIMLISQMIKGCKEKFFINQIFDENIRRLHQGKKLFGKKMLYNKGTEYLFK